MSQPYLWQSQRSSGVVGEAAEPDAEVEDSDDEEEESGFRQGGKELFEDLKDVLIFVVDCTNPEMFTPPPGESESAVVTALKCFAEVVEDKSMKSPSDRVSLVFYGTRQTKSISQAFNAVYEYSGLELPDSERVHEINKLADDIQRGGIEYFNRMFGIGTGDLASLLHFIKTRFAAEGPNTSKRAMFVTNQDVPERNPENIRIIRNHYKELIESHHALFSLFPVQNEGDDQEAFDISKFWAEVLIAAPIFDEDDMPPLQDVTSNLKDLADSIRRNAERKRSYMRIPFELGSGLVIGIRGYNLVTEQKKPNAVHISATSNEMVKTKQVIQDRDSSRTLAPTEIRYAYYYGGEKVTFSKEELAAVRNFGPPGLTMLGFKPKSKLKLQHTIKHSTFIYPDELEYRGSTAILATLLKRMTALEKVAICKFIPRKNSGLRLVALWPEERTVNGIQPGLHLIPLPFADDIRHIPASTDLRANAEAVEIAKQMVKGILLKNFDPQQCPNPALSFFHNNLAAIALNRDVPEPVKDEAVPDNEYILEKMLEPMRKLQDEIGELVNDLPPEAVSVPTQAGPSKKRARGAGDSGEPAEDGGTEEPKAKKEKPEVDLNEVENHARAGKLDRLTIPILTAYLKAKGVKARGKKQDLVDAVKEHLNL